MKEKRMKSECKKLGDERNIKIRRTRDNYFAMQLWFWSVIHPSAISKLLEAPRRIILLGDFESFYLRNASIKPPSTVITCPVVLLRRLLTQRKIASAWSAGSIGTLVSVRSA
jgi:hypothetical protein